MIQYLIIDDEHIAHDIIKGYCDLLPNFQLMQHCYDALEALAYLNKHPVDLIFLDLNMPSLKGFEFLRTLSDPPQVIVTTAYQEFALEGYELNVVDYLLKPFSFERFLTAINKATSVVNKASSSNIKVSDAASKSIFLRSSKKYIQVDLKELQYLEAAGNYTKVVTTKGNITIREKISDLLITLPKDEFLQVHKSFGVAIRHIDSVEGNRIYIDGQLIPIGKVYKRSLDTLLK